jgi:cell shape-determining protein MreC
LGRSSVSGSAALTLKNLQVQNQYLTGELKSKDVADVFQEGRYQYLKADVYSEYPFSDKSVFIIDKGLADGVTSDTPVVSSPGFIIGKIIAVKRTESEVQTIFDPSWKSSVSVRVGGPKALFTGGATPGLDFIPKDALVSGGDLVVNLSPEYPIGFVLGQVKDFKAGTENGVWSKATVDPVVHLNDVNTVYLVQNFP